MANGSFLDRVRVMLETLGVSISGSSANIAGDLTVSGSASFTSSVTVSGAAVFANAVLSFTNLPGTSGSAVATNDVYVSSNSTLKLKS